MVSTSPMLWRINASHTPQSPNGSMAESFLSNLSPQIKPPKLTHFRYIALVQAAGSQ
jgi:hypothetical protein